MESPPFKIGQDRDRISNLPDDLLLGIIERLSLREAVRAGGVSRRWRHLPHQLSRLHLDADDFHGTTVHHVMEAFTGATRRLLSVCHPAECKCDCKWRRVVKTLILRFYLSDPHLSSISHVVEDTVTRGETQSFEFSVVPPSSELIADWRAEFGEADWRAQFGKQFINFSRASPVAFKWLTGLSLTSLKFSHSNLLSLIGACDRLKQLSLASCRLVKRSVLKIDVPNSVIDKLEFINFRCTRIDLVSVPKLTHLLCHDSCKENPPLLFGYVPGLLTVNLASHAKASQAPFALSECFSMNVRNLSTLYLSFEGHMIWIQPERPKKLTAIFSNLKDVALWCFFPECGLNWTLFILEAVPALQMFTVNQTRHWCVQTSEDSAEKANVVWEPSKDLKHQNLKLLVMIGFEEEDKVVNFIRLVMELTTGLKTIKLQSQICQGSNAIDLDSLRKSGTDEASKHRIKERLTRGCSSSVEIIIC